MTITGGNRTRSPIPTGVVALAALTVLLALGSTGCPSFSTFQTPRTVPKGKFREAVGLQIVRMRTSEGAHFTVPTLEVGGRYGVSDSFDIGGKVSYAGYISAEVGFKAMLLRGPLDMAIAPAFSFLTFNSGSDGADDGFTLFHLHLPLLMGVELGEQVTLGFGPKFLYSSMRGVAGDSSADVLFNGPQVGGYVNLPVEVGSGIWIAPEINVYTPLRDFGGFANVQGGIVVMFGGHEYKPGPTPPPGAYGPPQPGYPYGAPPPTYYPPPPPVAAPYGAAPAPYYPPPPPVAAPYGAPPPPPAPPPAP